MASTLMSVLSIGNSITAACCEPGRITFPGGGTTGTERVIPSTTRPAMTAAPASARQRPASAISFDSWATARLAAIARHRVPTIAKREDTRSPLKPGKREQPAVGTSE